ncbi:mediator of RNA polymerase II transcription subunit 8 isoform X2 [Amborella trichopoda]|uniref:mediator of RNA polymerase II transcription subunit 8 isoform X2 n=1 Tax=Amborella trichopoda TaxID=13333 RepID=UPI0005D32D95|nr:mediator of RNA polymerase II transcription subunit 8 isoform X2 [Amborella trichopoda]|eukprot:XP_011625734.1 mediator of RNA polymerase II transcription subunit 8 isoform X2 [Amborella trichopoda]
MATENVQGQAQAQAQAQVQAEKLNQALQHQLNLEGVRTRALDLFNTISRLLEIFDPISRANPNLRKWQDILGQFSMVNLELFHIVEEVKKVSKAFVVHPKNVNAENSTILPVMLSSKLLPEMESEETSMKEKLLHSLSHLPVSTQIERLKSRIDMIAAACDGASKAIADARKAYGLGSRQVPSMVPPIDKVQAAKIQEQEKLLKAAVNVGDGLRIPGDQKHLPSVLPAHLVDALSSGDGVHPKNPQAISTNNIGTQGTAIQNSYTQFGGRSVPSPSGGTSSIDNTSASPLPYANSPRSGTGMMNVPSPQQQSQQQQQHQRQKLMQLPQHQQQLISQQQLRQSASPGLSQNAVPQLHDFQVQNQQKFQQAQFSQPQSHQQLQNRPLQSAHIQHNIGQSQMSQANQLRSHLGQYTGTASTALFNAAQASTNSQMMPNMPAAISSQSILPRMQLGQRSHPSQMLNEQMFNMGATNSANMAQMQQQQQFGGVLTNTQNLQQGLVNLQNPQNSNYPQQRQPQQ